MSVHLHVCTCVNSDAKTQTWTSIVSIHAEALELVAAEPAMSRSHWLVGRGQSIGQGENFTKFVAKSERAQRGEKFCEIYSACVLWHTPHHSLHASAPRSRLRSGRALMMRNV